MTIEELKNGVVVRLNSGSVLMTVMAVYDESFRIGYWGTQTQKIQVETFPVSAISAFTVVDFKAGTGSV